MTITATAVPAGSCGARYGGTCRRPVSAAAVRAGTGCYLHGVEGARSNRHPTPVTGTLAAHTAATLAAAGEDPSWTPDWYETSLGLRDTAAWKAALKAAADACPDLAGVSVTGGSSRDRFLILTPAPGAHPATVVEFALAHTDPGTADYLRFRLGGKLINPETLTHSPAHAAVLFHGNTAVGQEWLAAAKAAGLAAEAAGSTFPAGESSTSLDLGVGAPVRMSRYDLDAWAVPVTALARRVVEAADAGDTAALERAAVSMRAWLHDDGDRRDWAGQTRAERRVAALTRPDGAWLERHHLTSREQVALLEELFPDRAEIGRAAAIVGHGHDSATWFATAVPCQYLTVTGAPCGNSTRAADRWCGACARVPACDLTSVPLVEAPAPAKAAVSAKEWPLSVASAPKEFTALLRAELAKLPATLETRDTYDEPVTVTRMDPASVKVAREKGTLVVTFPQRWRTTSPRSAEGLSVADRRDLTALLRAHVDPGLLLSGLVKTRSEPDKARMARFGQTRRSAREKDSDTRTVLPLPSVAVEVMEARIAQLHPDLADVVVSAVDDRWSQTPVDDTREGYYGLKVAWSDGPRTLAGQLGDLPQALTDGGQIGTREVRTVSAAGVTMDTLRHYLAGSLAEQDPATTAAWEEYPERWREQDAATWPQVDESWVAQVAPALTRMAESGTDVKAFCLTPGALASFCDAIGAAAPPAPVR